MPKYTFAELLTIFFYINTFEIEKTKKALATELNISLRTLANWFSGDYKPRSFDIVEHIAEILWLNQIQTDVLLASINPRWVRYGTPTKHIETFDFVRYNEIAVSQATFTDEVIPTIEQIEQEWNLIFYDMFETNYRKWGTGTKDNGYTNLKKYIEKGQYTLRLQSNMNGCAIMGGDSTCQSPEVYYIRFDVHMVQGDSIEDGYGIMFEEICDECFAFFRIREKQRKVSVVQGSLPGSHQFKIYINQQPTLSIRPKEVNTLALLTVYDKHYFYVNEVLVGECVIPRLPLSRLDVGIVAGYKQEVICKFGNFRVYVP